MEMKLSNTLLIEKKLLPSYNKAFTLAEVLITLSILGVVAALTIPSLVNRQSQVAARSRIKKAIANYEQVTAVYMAENGENDVTGMVEKLGEYFKPVDGTVDGAFKTADGVYWQFNGDGNATACDSAASPHYCVKLFVNKDGYVNYGSPESTSFPNLGTGSENVDGYAADILKSLK